MFYLRWLGAALVDSVQGAYGQLVSGAGGEINTGAIMGAIQSGVQGVTDLKVETPAGPVIDAGADTAATARATEETAKQTKRDNDYLEIISGNMINLTPAFGQQLKIAFPDKPDDQRGNRGKNDK